MHPFYSTNNYFHVANHVWYLSSYIPYIGYNEADWYLSPSPKNQVNKKIKINLIDSQFENIESIYLGENWFTSK